MFSSCLDEIITDRVCIWWFALCIVAVLNTGLWSAAAVMLTRRRSDFSAVAYQRRRSLLWLAAVYVAGCAFRSFLPRIDLERICLVDSWLSNMVVGRGVATVAELCLIAQSALLLYEAGKGARVRSAVIASMIVVPLIVIAEGASWYAILSTDYLGHVVENSIWTFSALLMMLIAILLMPKSTSRQSRFLVAIIVLAVGCIGFMATVDVPMYWSRWQAELARGAVHLTLLEGLADAVQPCILSFDWQSWRDELPWMTLYFTIAVWFSILLPHAPYWGHATFSEQQDRAR